MSTIKPLDEEAVLCFAKECKLVITSEEHSVIGGLGGAVCEYLSSTYPVKAIRHGINDIFGQSADGNVMLDKYSLRAQNLVDLVLANIK